MFVKRNHSIPFSLLFSPAIRNGRTGKIKSGLQRRTYHLNLIGIENIRIRVELLCEGTVIVGDIKTKNDIRIDGIIKGKIITSGRLVVGNTAKIEGNIDCCNVDVLGVVLGDIQASGTVSLKSSAKVIGNIVSSVLSFEPGVIFNGNCQMTKKEGREPAKE